MTYTTRTKHSTKQSAGFLYVLTFVIPGVAYGPTYPKCDDDSDCRVSEYCVNGSCQQCRDSSDCESGQKCAAGRCEAIEGYCTTDNDCSPDEKCRANRCRPQERAAAPIPEPTAPCILQSVYFDFDPSTIKKENGDQLAANADCLREKKATKVTLTGHCDPRGTEEYNLALGDRRARAASEYLKSLGLDAEITHMSMGEEMARGTDEASWARDRRVDIDIIASDRE